MYSFSLKKYITTAILALTVCWLFGQHKPIINYTTHNGLPQIQARTIFQDSRGYIWTGTKSGLVCFNGIEFTPFLPNENIQTIKESENGHLFFKTLNSLYRYNGKTMRCVYKNIHPFQFSPAKNNLWIWSQSQLLLYNNDSLIQTFTPGVNLPPGGIGTLEYDKTSGTVYYSDVNGSTIYKLIDSQFQKFFVAEKGTSVYLQTFRNGIIALAEFNGISLSLKNIESKEIYYTCFISNNKVDSIQVNYLPLAYHLHIDHNRFIKIDSATCTATNIELDFIKDPFPIIFDTDMNIWAGSDNGLYHIINSPFEVYDRSFMNDFWTIIKGADGQFYGASFKEGLFKLDFGKQRKQEIVAFRQNKIKETDYYYGASKDEPGNLYFPTHFGIIKYNYKTAKKLDTGISLISKYDSVSKKIIIGQCNGIAFIDKNENIEYCIDSTAEICVSHPTSIEFQNDSIIWIGTGKSLAQFNRSTKKFCSLISENQRSPRNGVIAMTKDYLGNIWLGGRDGLWLFRNETKNFERVDKGLIESNIAALIAPNPRLLVIGTSREIYLLNLEKFYSTGELEMRLYNYQNGFIAEEICQNGFLPDGNKLIIPSTTYTSVMDIEKVNFNTEFNNVRIIQVNGEGIEFGMKTDEPYTIKRGLNELEINYETIGFGLPTTPRFKYKLIGFDKGWHEWTTNTNAHYSNLPSGKYTFTVVSKTGASISDSQQKSDSITLRISLPFYKEPNLYKYAFFVFLLLSSIIIYFGWSRLRYKIKISEREQKIRYLEIATLQAQLNPHFIFNFLASVQSLISKNKPEDANSYLVKFSRLMRAYMESSIKSSKVLSGLSVSHEITISEEIELLRMYIDLEAMKYKTGKINYEIVVSDDQLLNKTIPPMIIQPLVENAIKHGILPNNEQGNLKISFTGGADFLECTIADDGIGIEKSSTLQNQSIKLYKSRGIELIRKKIEILNELGYNIDIKYLEVEKGTTVCIHFNS